MVQHEKEERDPRNEADLWKYVGGKAYCILDEDPFSDPENIHSRIQRISIGWLELSTKCEDRRYI